MHDFLDYFWVKNNLRINVCRFEYHYQNCCENSDMMTFKELRIVLEIDCSPNNNPKNRALFVLFINLNLNLLGTKNINCAQNLMTNY